VEALAKRPPVAKDPLVEILSENKKSRNAIQHYKTHLAVLRHWYHFIIIHIYKQKHMHQNKESALT
jgi:hypothetical protein